MQVLVSAISKAIKSSPQNGQVSLHLNFLEHPRSVTCSEPSEFTPTLPSQKSSSSENLTENRKYNIVFEIIIRDQGTRITEN